MDRIVDYYFAPHSPWSYLGHDRFAAMARRFAIVVRPKPVDLTRVLAASGGVPLAQRPAQRRSYRLLELARYGEDLGLPIVVQPRCFPLSQEAASLLILATLDAHGSDIAMTLTGAIMRALWEQERDISKADVLEAIVRECALDPAPLVAAAKTDAVRATYDANTAEAIAAEVFGAPTFIPRFGPAKDQRFWGQDRLDFLERAIAGG